MSDFYKGWKLQGGLCTTNVLVATLEKCERLQKQLDIAVHVLEKYANRDFEEYKPYIWDRGNAARKALVCIKVEELKK